MSTNNGFSGKKAVVADRAQTSMSYYGVFGLEPGAKPEEIKDAFFAAIREFNPASPLSADESKVAQVLIEAYHVLSDPKQREKYDKRFGDISAGKGGVPEQTTNPMFWLYGDSKSRARADYELLTKGLQRLEDSRVLDLTSDRELGAACVWAITSFAKGPPKTKEYKEAVSPQGVPTTETYYDDNMAILRKKLRDPKNKDVAITLAAIGGFSEVKNMAGEFVIEQGRYQDLMELAGRESCTGETRLHAVQKLTMTLTKDQLKGLDLHLIPPLAHFGTQEINLHVIITDATKDAPELPVKGLTAPALENAGDRLVIKGLPRMKAPALLERSILQNPGSSIEDVLRSSRFSHSVDGSVAPKPESSDYIPPMVATQELKVETLSIDDLYKIVQDKLPGRIRATQELISRADKAEALQTLVGLFSLLVGNDDHISKCLLKDLEPRIISLDKKLKARQTAEMPSREEVRESVAKASQPKSARTPDAANKGAVPRPDPTKLKR